MVLPACHSYSLGRLRAGDSDEWNSIVRRMNPMLASWCKRRVPRDEVEDVLSQVWLNAWKGLPGFQPRRTGAGIGTWLFSIAQNACIDYYRRRRMPTMKVAEIAALIPGRPDPDPLDDPDLFAGIENMTYRFAARLRWSYGLSYNEISRTMGIPRGTVASMLTKTRRRLKDHESCHLEGARVPCRGSGDRARPEHGLGARRLAS